MACADGSGTIVVGVHVNQAQLMAGYFLVGHWIAIRGTGDYERVTGTGTIDGACDADRANCTFEYTGPLDLTRDVEPHRPPQPRPAGVTSKSRMKGDSRMVPSQRPDQQSKPASSAQTA